MKMAYIFGLAVLTGVLALFALRANAQRVATMRDEILQKDQSGKNVSADIESLRTFTTKHMNSSVTFELSGSYQRAVDKAQKQASPNESGRLYQRAQAVCDRPGVSSVAQAQCVQKYVSARLDPGNNPKPYKPPERSNFIRAFVSPTWTPDLAGFLLLGSIGLGIAALALYLKRVVEYEYHHHPHHS